VIHLVVIDSNENTSTQRVYNQDKVVQWKMKVDIAGSILLVVLQHFFLLILYFANTRDSRANRHPGHRNRRRTSNIIFVSNSSGTSNHFTMDTHK